jgi:hypothetical protein
LHGNEEINQLDLFDIDGRNDQEIMEAISQTKRTKTRESDLYGEALQVVQTAGHQGMLSYIDGTTGQTG